MIPPLPQDMTNALEIFSLFVIPIGGGIPAGVILAKNRGVIWPMTAFIYLCSDILLAFVFEQVLLYFIRKSKDSEFLRRFGKSYKESLDKVGFRLGLKPTPLSFIILSFGADPMTSRTLSRSAGHGAVAGWTFAICGDMIFFGLIMASTLLLNNILGDGTWAAVIVTAIIILATVAHHRWKEWRNTTLAKR
jgi:hypothetical protein